MVVSSTCTFSIKPDADLAQLREGMTEYSLNACKSPGKIHCNYSMDVDARRCQFWEMFDSMKNVHKHVENCLATYEGKIVPNIVVETMAGCCDPAEYDECVAFFSQWGAKTVTITKTMPGASTTIMALENKAVISADEGKDLARRFLESNSKCFGDNDFASQRAMIADNVSWDWADGTRGQGSKDDFYAVLGKSWQLLVSQFIPTSIFSVVNTKTGIISTSFNITLVVDGRGKVPISPSSTFVGQNMFELHVNSDHKITHFRGLWDANNEELMARVQNVMTAPAAAA